MRPAHPTAAMPGMHRRTLVSALAASIPLERGPSRLAALTAACGLLAVLPLVAGQADRGEVRRVRSRSPLGDRDDVVDLDRCPPATEVAGVVVTGEDAGPDPLPRRPAHPEPLVRRPAAAAAPRLPLVLVAPASSRGDLATSRLVASTGRGVRHASIVARTTDHAPTRAQRPCVPARRLRASRRPIPAPFGRDAGTPRRSEAPPPGGDFRSCGRRPRAATRLAAHTESQNGDPPFPTPDPAENQGRRTA